MNFDNFRLWLQEEGKRSNTITRYIKVASDFIDWHMSKTGQTFDPRLVTPLDMQDWKSYLLNEATYVTSHGQQQRYSVSTVNNAIKSIKVFFDYLQEQGVIPSNPAVKLRPQRVQEFDQPRWLDRAERSRLLFYIDNAELRKKNAWRFTRNRAICFVMLHAGLRVSEVANLELDDLDFYEEILHVRDGKGGKSRHIPMNKDLVGVLEEWLEYRDDVNTKKVFISQRKNALTVDGIEHLFRSLSVKVGIPDLTPHVLRHTFAHDLAERGESLQTIARLLGHTNINYTKIYVSPSREETRAAVNKLAGERYS
ncbi:tyrosine-type recombinase/integrase [Insulibacter thermoxylanivorax]|uniref:tyrosine-type recombinase/integrase n=1 Tax=Insulibacter thermoxylanivorax TaxID=2749268 RepID=UPI001910CFA8|nr:tyrosine-type recombinase/integrase [Insulibacter thermoxylanivorax]